MNGPGTQQVKLISVEYPITILWTDGMHGCEADFCKIARDSKLAGVLLRKIVAGFMRHNKTKTLIHKVKYVHGLVGNAGYVAATMPADISPQKDGLEDSHEALRIAMGKFVAKCVGICEKHFSRVNVDMDEYREEIEAMSVGEQSIFSATTFALAANLGKLGAECQFQTGENEVVMVAKVSSNISTLAPPFEVRRQAVVTVDGVITHNTRTWLRLQSSRGKLIEVPFEVRMNDALCQLHRPDAPAMAIFTGQTMSKDDPIHVWPIVELVDIVVDYTQMTESGDLFSR